MKLTEIEKSLYGPNLLVSIKDGHFTGDWTGKTVHGKVYISPDHKLLDFTNGPFVIDGSLIADGIPTSENRQNGTLTSLKGSPRLVNSIFTVSNNGGLTSLEGLPDEMGDLYCCNCNLTSLKGAEKAKMRKLKAYTNNLTSVAGAPERVSTFDVSFNPFLGSLKNGPSIVSEYVCDDCGIKSLDGLDCSIGKLFYAVGNKISNLHDIHKRIRYDSQGGVFGFKISLNNNPIKSHVLGLLKIAGLKEVSFDNQKLESIINKYLPLGDILDCQEELIEAGLEEFAQL